MLTPRYYHSFYDSTLFLPDGKIQRQTILDINDRHTHRSELKIYGDEATHVFYSIRWAVDEGFINDHYYENILHEYSNRETVPNSIVRPTSKPNV